MADPISATAAISMGASAGGSLLSAFGAVSQGDATAQAYQYKAGVAMINKQINEQNANWATQAGDIASQEKGLAAGQDIAKTKVAQAASGFDVTSGTGANIREAQTSVAQFDQNVIRWDAAKTSWGYEAKATADQAEANADQAAAANAKKGGMISALGSILSGGASVASKWSQGNTLGMGTGQIGTFSNGGNDGMAPSWG